MNVTIRINGSGFTARIYNKGNSTVVESIPLNTDHVVDSGDIPVNGFDPIFSIVNDVVLQLIPDSGTDITDVEELSRFDPVSSTTVYLTFSEMANGNWEVDYDRDIAEDWATQTASGIDVTASVPVNSIDLTFTVVDEDAIESVTLFDKGTALEVLETFTLNAVNTLAKADVPNAGFDPGSGNVITPVIRVTAAEGATVNSISSDFATIEFTNEGGGIWDAPFEKGDITVSEAEITIDAEAAEPEIPDFNMAYLLGNDELGDLASENGYITYGGASREVSEFITSFFKVPFDISTFGGDAQAIQVADQNLTTTAPVITNNPLVIDLGAITVPSISGDSSDYLATKYELIVPFVEKVFKLEPHWVVGNDVTVELQLEIFSKTWTLNLRKSGELVLSENVDINESLLLKWGTGVDDVQRKGVYNGVLTPYVRATKAELLSGDFANLVQKDGPIGSYEGYAEVEQIALNSYVREHEEAEIRRRLKAGVVVK